MSDRITLTGVRATGYHGVYEHERREGQVFIADVVLELSLADAARSDDVADTVHYGELADQVAAVLAGDPADLLETVAQRVADRALGYARVDAVEVTIHKPQAPIAVPFDDVSVSIRRVREGASA
ncbi:dihydroneopterin aldolase [Microbacterium hominis]|uniref:7,8-dihydroneopterin aldolase n=1 Tax=Microbacterium hominis TaxID=162426 RepID=A0A134DEQ3_9MICO|nr:MULTISPECIES: dihydroneopterin aldolase [Microbacterium]AUG30826.1 dihydroneopterin aldolase [Microbacterium hominis]KXC05024.1 dihydroneopterin aldolase [Microbacterium hominis]QOC26593.1 dihydroneopterin aldolase [Microbacterium hominis]QOC27765.1 dihydroneopterin aldolase [Microbacterium hominis]QRY39456.1 dihydroneopterin aldolase [Microbacterium hominis]